MCDYPRFIHGLIYKRVRVHYQEHMQLHLTTPTMHYVHHSAIKDITYGHLSRAVNRQRRLEARINYARSTKFGPYRGQVIRDGDAG